MKERKRGEGEGRGRGGVEGRRRNKTDTAERHLCITYICTVHKRIGPMQAVNIAISKSRAATLKAPNNS
jgi:hypothetical protein